MSVSEEVVSRERPGLNVFLFVSLALHTLVLAYFLLTGGILGVEGPGGGDALYFELSAGDGQDQDAAADLDAFAAPDPQYADADIEPVPEPKPDVIPLRKSETSGKAEKTTPVKGRAQTARPSGSKATTGKDAGGSGEAGKKTVLNVKGSTLTGSQIALRSSGAVFRGEMGNFPDTGGNRYINMVIRMHPDGRTDVEFDRYHYKLFHQKGAAKRHYSEQGRWWVKGDKWCHQSRSINYGLPDCYHMTLEGSTIRLAFPSTCADQYSLKCLPNQQAGEFILQ